MTMGDSRVTVAITTSRELPRHPEQSREARRPAPFRSASARDTESEPPDDEEWRQEPCRHPSTAHRSGSIEFRVLDMSGSLPYAR